MSLNLMISLLALTVIMASVNQIKMAPTESAKSPISKNYYLTRAWGESSIPFSVIYSNYAREKLQQESGSTTSTTMIPPKQQSRKKYLTKKSSLPNLFVSNGWGPLG